MQPVVDSIHEHFIGVEALGSQTDLHLGEEMVIAWRQVWSVRRVVGNLPVVYLDLSICASQGVGAHVVVILSHRFVIIRFITYYAKYSVFKICPVRI